MPADLVTGLNDLVVQRLVVACYEVGKVGLNRAKEAQAQLTDAKLKLSKMKRKIALKQNRR